MTHTCITVIVRRGNWVWGLCKFADGTSQCWFKFDTGHIAGTQYRVVEKLNEYWINASFTLATRCFSLLPYVLAGKSTIFISLFFKCLEPKALLRGSLGQWHLSWMPLGKSLNKSYLACGSSDVSFSHYCSAQGSKKQNLLSLHWVGFCASGYSLLEIQQGGALLLPPETVGPESVLWLKLRSSLN